MRLCLCLCLCLGLCLVWDQIARHPAHLTSLGQTHPIACDPPSKLSYPGGR
ncbi:hypothetical protein KC19_3G118000 [Ceratodon purpureus]|uniref:Uncharacterized protein n=1 Tax=Ceratodon purpureus TaxID=3225 RepID=A0A8T0IJT4_CERPU|nr:hypothetical protein KC19_3G118000 [Ceratodon purpureus]